MIKILAATAALAAVMTVSSASATIQLLAKSYDMPNGGTGGGNDYLDSSYGGVGATGNPAAIGSSLAGGAGELTDGVISAAHDWTGPYVGWLNINPTITFHFDGPPTITEIVFHFDDNDGGAGVGAPLSVEIDGGAAVPIADPAGSDPFAFSVTGLSITKSSFDVVINRRTEWIMLSEVQFFGEAAQTPGPAPLALLAAGFVGIAGFARRRKG